MFGKFITATFVLVTFFLPHKHRNYWHNFDKRFPSRFVWRYLTDENCPNDIFVHAIILFFFKQKWFWQQNLLGNKYSFGYTIFFWKQKFLRTQNFRNQNFFRHKTFFAPKLFYFQILWDTIFFCPKIFLLQAFWIKYHRCWNKLGLNWAKLTSNCNWTLFQLKSTALNWWLPTINHYI